MAIKAELQYFGHSTVLLTTETGKKVFIDPWLSGNPSCPEQLHEPAAVDYICLTHGHGDHTGSVVSLAKRYGAKIFATFELANLLVHDGVPGQQVTMMNNGGTLNIALDGGKSLGITLTRAIHSSSYDSSDGKTYYAGEAGGIAVRLESGQTIYHAGDTMLFSDMELIGKKFKPTVAFIPVGDCFTMGPEDAAEAARLFGAKISVPIHWGTFPVLSGTPQAFADAVKKLGVDTEVKIIQPGDTFLL